MPNKYVKDETIKILLDRREELQKRINKDMKEYKALGDIITRLRQTEEKLKIAEEKLKNQDELYR